MIAIVDYNTGNLRSVENAVRSLGGKYVVTADIETIRAADHVILPGVGEARSAMQELKKRGLDEVIPYLKQPVLGICIGIQLMCRHSEEGDAQCLGIFPSNVRKFNAYGDKSSREDTLTVESHDYKGMSTRYKIPHMGWNTIEELDSPLFEGIASGSFVYFVHSFAPDLCEGSIARTSYAGREFSAAIARGNFYGTQFHPEKSGEVGRSILRNFLNIR